MSGRSVWRGLLPLIASAGVAAVIVAFWFVSSGDVSFLRGGGYTVKVTTPTAAGLGSGTSVRMAGIQIGQVTAVRREGAGAVLTLHIDAKHGPLPRDSSAAIRLRTLVGENYVSITRGHAAQAIQDGGALSLDPQREYVEVDEILSVLRGRTRERARQMLQGLDRGIDGRGDEINAVIDDASGFVRGATTLTNTLHRDRRQVARLVDNLGNVMRVVGDRGAGLRSLANESRTTFLAVAAHDDAVRATLAALPPTLRQVRDTTGTLRKVSGTATPTIARLAGTVRALGPSVQLLEPAAQTARRAVRELGVAASPLTATVGELKRLAKPASRALPDVQSVLCQVNPALTYLSPYARDISTVLLDLGSITNWYDATGHAARLFVSAGANDLAAFTPGMASLTDRLLSEGLIGRVGVGKRGYNALPAPGALGDLTEGLGVSGPGDVHKPYPHIKAAC